MELLDNIELLSDLSIEEKNTLGLFAQEKFISAGEELFREGDEANAMYILASGSVEISRNNLMEKEVLGEVQAEEIIGEMALFGGGGKRMATATALEDSTLLTILSFSIHELIEKHPILLDKIRSIIEERMMDNKIKEASREE